MSSLRVGVDVDDVLADFMGAFVTYFNELNGTNYSRDQLHSYQLWPILGGDPHSIRQHIWDFYDTPHFINLPLIYGSQQGIQKLKQKHELMVVTSRPNTAADVTKNWIETHFADSFKTVHHATYFQHDRPKQTKAELCSDLGIDILIEDHIDYAHECAALNVPVILFNTPWNQGRLPKTVTRAHSWDEVAVLLKAA